MILRNKKNTLVKWPLLLVIILFLSACGGGDSGTTVPTAPAVRVESFIISTIPLRDIALVDVNASFKLTFDKNIDINRLKTAFSITGNVTGNWSFDSTSLTATFVPVEPLAYSETYVITMTSTPIQETGNVLGADYSWSFTTQTQTSVQNSQPMDVAILDLASRNAASSTNTKALMQVMDIMGMPYIVTEQISEALSYPVIYTTSFIIPTTFDALEKQSIVSYVENGGTLIANNLTDPGLYALFGISDQLRINTRNAMNWNSDLDYDELSYIDSVEEAQASLGGSGSSFIYTRSYGLDGATELANYADGSTAITVNNYANGRAYLLGISYTDIILRNQMNRDFDAGTGSINEFEATTDMFMLFLRSIYGKNTASPVWKHTSPGMSKAVLIVTHDVDSQSSVDWLRAFIDMETEKDLSASYNINTHYINDFNDGDYYTMNIDTYLYALEQGHVISSHSVGHFPDFENEDIVLKGVAGNTFENYQPEFNGVTTLNATVFGELEVSKALLDSDLNIDVVTFRSGHLAWNDHQVSVLEELGYRYDSSMSGNDVLSYFPYRLLYGDSLAAERSTIYEFPLAMSDGSSTYEDIDGAVSVWLDILGKNMNNNAPSVLLVHPNREEKLNDLDSFLSQLPEGLTPMNMDAFGDFWVLRDEFDFRTELENNKLTIYLTQEHSFPLNADVSLVIKNGVALSAVDILTPNGNTIDYIASKEGENIKLHGFKNN